MANFNEKSFIKKLRGTDTSKFRSQYRYHANFNLQPNCELLDNSYISQENTYQNNVKSKINTEPNKKKCGDKGMAIAHQMSPSITNKKLKMKHSQYRQPANFDLHSDCEFPDISYVCQEYTNHNNLKPELKTDPSIRKCSGTKRAIAQIKQSVMNNNLQKLKMKNFNPEYSNLRIEQHFKNLKRENAKKIEEQNEKILEEILYSTMKEV